MHGRPLLCGVAMRTRCLLPCPESLRCTHLHVVDGVTILDFASARPACACPVCGVDSRRIHSWYERRLKVLPWHGQPVEIRWRTRKFFCDNPDCSRRVFVERLPNVADSHARRTSRLELALRAVALACGDAPGDRRPHSSPQGAQATDVRSRRLRSAAHPGSMRGVSSLMPTSYQRSTP